MCLNRLCLNKRMNVKSAESAGIRTDLIRNEHKYSSPRDGVAIAKTDEVCNSSNQFSLSVDESVLDSQPSATIRGEGECIDHGLVPSTKILEFFNQY